MDVFEFAMQMELQGKEYYERMAASTRVPGLRTIFAGLAADEQKHYEVFRELKEGGPWQMADSHLLDQAKSVFDEMLSDRERLPEFGEDLEGYKHGLQVEQDSIKLYEEMATKEQDPEIVQLYLKLANEEKKHYNIVDNICDFLMRPKYYLEWREFSNLHPL